MATRSFFRNSMRYLFLALAGLLVVVLLTLILLRFVNPPTSAFMIAHQLKSSGTINQQWVPIEEISPHMPRAVMASEDQRFPEHWGLDMHAIRAALHDYRQGQNLRGASTITQQTAKNLFLWEGRSLVRKGVEAGLAVGIEATWPKHRIMEVYLNIAEFGEGIYGVEAASQHFFGISARHLNAQQAARLAAVLPSPKRFNAGAPSPYIWERVSWIQGQMIHVADYR